MPRQFASGCHLHQQGLVSLNSQHAMKVSLMLTVLFLIFSPIFYMRSKARKELETASSTLERFDFSW
jgi:hypothetical protein